MVDEIQSNTWVIYSIYYDWVQSAWEYKKKDTEEKF